MKWATDERSLCWGLSDNEFTHKHFPDISANKCDLICLHSLSVDVTLADIFMSKMFLDWDPKPSQCLMIQ